MNKKGFVHILPLVLVGLLIASGVYYFKNQIFSKESQDNNSIVQEEKSEDSRIYSQERFEFKYPESSHLDEKTDESNNLFITVLNQHGNTCVQMSIEPISTSKNITFLEFVSDEVGESKSYEYPGYFSQGKDDFIYTITWTTLNNKVIGEKDWYSIEPRNNYENIGLPIDYLYTDDNSVWLIEVETSESFCEQDLVDNILNSFQFKN